MAAIKDIIILITPDKTVETWTQIGAMCKAHDLCKGTVYNYFKRDGMCVYRGFKMVRQSVNTVMVNNPAGIKVSFDTKALAEKLREVLLIVEGGV